MLATTLAARADFGGEAPTAEGGVAMVTVFPPLRTRCARRCRKRLSCLGAIEAQVDIKHHKLQCGAIGSRRLWVQPQCPQNG
jgi:hypothetical protein